MCFTYSYNDVWNISLFGKHFKSTDSFFVANNVFQSQGAIFLDPIIFQVSTYIICYK
jgi:hypothetical protein